MNAFGLTGNIGCGKSEVARLLAEYHDVVVFDSDRIAKGVIADPAHRAEAEGVLGAGVFRADASVDFKVIAAIIFADAEKKRQFEALIHPLAEAKIECGVAEIPPGHLAIVESAILYESGWETRFVGGVIVAVCNEVEQLRRLRELRKMSDADIRARCAAQLPAAEKEKRAQFVIRTDCSMAGLRRNVSVLYWQLKRAKGA